MNVSNLLNSVKLVLDKNLEFQNSSELHEIGLLVINGSVLIHFYAMP
jgi:hypothetical protein